MFNPDCPNCDIPIVCTPNNISYTIS
jgi:hypothetical protein